MISGFNFNLMAFDSLESQKKRLCLLSKTAEIGDWSHTLNTDITTWSEYLYDFYELDKNYDCSTLLESTHFYQGSEKERMLALIAQVTSERTERTEEFMIVMDDGRFKWHTTTIYPMLDEQGSLIGLYGILQNITEKKQVAENKKKEHILYNYILDRLPIELVVLNKEGRYIYANDAAIKSKERRGIVIGINPSGDSDLENWIPAVESRRNEVMTECTVNKKSVTFEEILTDSDGTERTYMHNMYPLLDKNGDAELLIGYGMDITARKKSELELQRMAIVAEKTNGIVMITDPEKRVIWINNSFEKILGYKSEEVIGIDPGIFLQGPETSIETIREITRSLRDTGTFSGEILNYTKSGNKIWLYLNIAAVYDDAGKLINYVAVENDITLIKMAEQRLQKAMEKERELNRFKTQFVNLASHQFRTPLATIRSSIDLLDLKMESTNLSASFIEFFQKHKTIMAEETTRMTELMENILDIGRIDEGKIELFKKNRPFQQFMDTFVQSNIEPIGQQRMLNYHFEAPDRIISMDEILLRNVLRNVVSNAFKYSEGKQAPELTVTFHDNAYLITIKDYGIGIPEKDQPFLFQSFFRASNAKVFPGSGLGLMIAKKLIVIHGGDISFASTTGNGCTVTIQLRL